ncbi:CAP domain-containing protein [Pedobacter sandarakinus]|uniref:CAP domain-containing protein n=1 Tax=Pedobacter sandarakinus TaxID=353156 RepID=UPI0022485D99|nr:CAP domain-containing protein [Pedobacter sandarakinus]MCX2575603.1 CAP domain-containing protein [Pedobacter sandarakinus]
MKTFVPIVCLAISCMAISCKKSSSSASAETTLIVPKLETNTNINNDALLKLVNDTRLAGCNCGATLMPPVSALTWNANLASAAIAQSKYMESINKMQHESANGDDVGKRITAAGYIWKTAGENIAQGQTSESQVFNDWIKSEGHCRNIMNGAFKEMGAAKSGTFWTQVFASK